jgi:hypothetical protein
MSGEQKKRAKERNVRRRKSTMQERQIEER